MEINRAMEKTFLREEFSMDFPRKQELYSDFCIPPVRGDTAMIPVVGPIGEWTRYSEITSAIEKMLKDKNVKNIVLSIDSPGGAVANLFDTCR